MLITQPNDGRGLHYYIINLTGQTVLIYQSLDAALRSREGDQRIAILDYNTGKWLTDKPSGILEAPIDVISKDGGNLQTEVAMIIASVLNPKKRVTVLERDLASAVVDAFMNSSLADAGIRAAYQSLPDA
jgi:hypothetical protein